MAKGKGKKIAIIGKYTTVNGVSSDGQAVKTNILSQEIVKFFGQDAVTPINTFGWKKHPVNLFLKSIRAVWHSEHVIFMTDEGGIKVFPWLLRLSNVFNTCSLHYVVVGGWLIHFVEKHPFIRACLKKFKGIYVETSVMKRALEKAGFQNVVLMPNFKPLEPLTGDELCKEQQEPFRFCTFSRVMEEKGIDDAVNAICAVNSHFGKTVCSLDIYGQVDPNQTEWFETLIQTFPPEVHYCGVVEYKNSVDCLKDYFALLFPTEFYTEGIPGTIIDAYAAGIPVVASRWESFGDVVDDGLTGIGYPFGEQKCLKEILVQMIENPDLVSAMKTNCLEKAYQYLPDNVMDILLSKLS